MRLKTANVQPVGLENDRRWLLIDQDNRLITARDYPALLQVQAQVLENTLAIRTSYAHKVFINDHPGSGLSFQFFNEQLEGITYSTEADAWFSDLLGISCRLVYQADVPRDMLEKRGGKPGDRVNYGDEAPILLIGDGSLEDLNAKLDKSVTMTHFRPNIVVKGCKPFAEDHWNQIRVGSCEFKVAQACHRCVFTTIDPITFEKDPKGEPLRTLSGYRKSERGVRFGVHLIPRKLGMIKVGDGISIMS